MDMAMKPQTSGPTTEPPGLAPPTSTTAHAPFAPNAHVDHVPRWVRWVQSFLAGLIIALSIGANVGFHNLLSRYDLVGGGGYVGALVVVVIVAIYTCLTLAINPVPGRLIAEYVAIPLWLVAGLFLAAESAIVMNDGCLYSCIYIYGAGPNAGCVAAALGLVEVGLFGYSALKGRRVRTRGRGSFA